MVMLDSRPTLQICFVGEVGVLSGYYARQFYSARGIETIPLKPGTKGPLAESWPTKPIADQWRNAPQNVNIGIRHCGDVINVECDEYKIVGTFDRVMAGLSGLGITNPPIVRSASGIGRHVYVRSENAPHDVAYRNLSRDVGAGELRIGIGAMSVLPDSQVGGATYELIAGDWQAIPVVRWCDLLWLLPLQRIVTAEEVLPVRLIWRYITPAILNLFEAIAKADRGETVGRYLSRSEAEAAIVAQLILNGWTFNEIRGEFRRQDVGHYAEMKRHKDRYLANTYGNALGIIASNHIRQALAADYRVHESAAWPGRTGNSDRLTYLALLSECYRVGGIETSASVRELSEHASIAIGTVQASLYRLAEDGLIERTRGAGEDGAIASVWKMLPSGDNRTGVTILNPVQLPPPPVSKGKLTSVQLPPLPHEIGSRAALGPSAVNVWQHLDVYEARNVSQLARLSGRARSTVKDALVRLNRHHLAIQTNGGSWLAGPNDLESVAADFGCDALAAARREKHTQDRARYQAFVIARKIESKT